MEEAIKVENLTKKFNHGRIKAVDNLNLKVKRGEIFGFLGPNGAGKTTTIRLLMDFIRPDKGKALIFGLDCQKDSVEIKKKVGYLAGDVRLYERYTGEYLTEFLANLNSGISENWVKELTDRLQIDTTRKISDLSRGNKQKIGILQALAHKPELLILDEPTTGLDPLMQLEFYKILKEMRKEGVTIFMSSHVLSEVQKVCDRVGILKEGKLIAVKDIDELLEAKIKIIEIHFKNVYKIDDFRLPGVKINQQDKKYLQLEVHGDINPIVKVLANYDLRDLSFNEPDLEDIFLEYYQGEK